MIEGGIHDTGELVLIERFLRAIVLHDEMGMVGQPMVREAGEDDDWTDEEIAAGGRNVLVGFAPVLDAYEGLLLTERRVTDEGVIPSKRLLDLAVEFSGAGPGDAYYKAHLGYLRVLTGVLASGGSVVSEGEVAKAALEKSADLPAAVFETLDGDWAEYARSARDGLGFVMPPVLTIVLSRAARREKLLAVIRDLRDEWSDARRKLWKLIATLRDPDTLKDAHDAQRELREAGKLFSPVQPEPSFAPLRLIWDVFAGGVATGATAALGASPETAITAGVMAAAKGAIENATRDSPRAWRYWFRSGAFDLARRVRAELLGIEPMRALLSRHLRDTEKARLGL